MINHLEDRKLLYDLFQAYYDARKNKRKTIIALAFEINYEKNIFQLYQEIKNRNYEINPSICFMINKPVKREVFAASFRDRVVHHLIYNYISPFFERLFINDSYSCRKNKGTLYGIKRLNHFILSCSRNYTRDCYILKLDIQGYFMSIDHNILYQKVIKTLERFKNEINFNDNLILWLIDKIIFSEPTKNCIFKTKKQSWHNFPRNKSLFHSGENKGLPIGNLTSQLFGNVYLSDFDYFVKYKLNCKYYGRYVDDLVIVHQNKEYLKSTMPLLKQCLKTSFLLKLHPRKVYLQHYSKGIDFLGAIIKPYRSYVCNRVKNNFYQTIIKVNNILKDKKINKQILSKALFSINSYLGLLGHHDTYKLRKKILTRHLALYFCDYVRVENSYGKIIPKI